MANSLPWFHSRQLAHCMARHLSQALEEERLSVIEYDWLGQLTDRPDVPADMQVSLLSNAVPGLLYGLMLTYTDANKPAAYFYSPVAGILPFADRDQLRDALLVQPSAVTDKPTEPRWLSLTRVPFQRWMQSIVQAQTTWFKALDKSWRQLPSLTDTLEQSLTAALRTALPASDPILPRHHKVQRIDSQNQSVTNVQSLLDAALEMLEGGPEAPIEHRFLGVYGQPLTAAEAQTYRATLTATVSQVGRDQSATLASFWHSIPGRASISRRHALSLALKHRYMSAILARQSDLTYSAAQIELLKSVFASKRPANACLEMLQFDSADPLRDAPIPWPGTLLISDQTDASLGYFVYNTDYGFTHCADIQALGEHLLALNADAATSLRVVQRDQALFNGTVAPVVQRVPLALDAFDTLADGLIDLQRRRVVEALSDPSALRRDSVAAAMDAADIRRLLHPHLPWCSPASRTMSSASSALDLTTTELRNNWVLQINALQARQHWQSRRAPTIADGVRVLLAPSLLALQSTLAVDALRLRIAGAPQLVSVSLIDYFLERISGAIVQKLTLADQVLDQADAPILWPDVTQIEQMIKACSPLLLTSYRQLVRRHMSRAQAHYSGAYDFPGQRRALREISLRNCLAIARREGVINEKLLAMLATALDRPTADLRNAQDIDVHAIYLQTDEGGASTPLGSVIALHRHSAPDGPVLLWSSHGGLQVFDSLSQLQRTLSAGLASPMAREAWLNRIDPVWAATLIEQNDSGAAPRIKTITHALTGDFIAQLDAIECHRLLNCVSINIELAVTCGFPARLFQSNVDFGFSNDLLAVDLERLAVDAANAQLVELLPSWITEASASQLGRYTAILQRCMATANTKSNYLAEIPYILDFSRERLKASMATAWPAGPADPDRVIVRLIDTSGGGISMGGGLALGNTTSQTKSLTEWAVSQFDASLSSAMDISLDPPSLVIATPSTHQVRSIVNDADVGGEYRKLLAEKLSTTRADYALRRRLFARALPAQMLRHAVEMEMQGTLSAKATRFLEQVVEMPDGVAREPLEGQPIGLGPLGLIPDVGMTPDIACGMYVIAPAHLDAGPVLLYTAYGEAQTLREYASRDALLMHIKTDPTLQRQILSRLPAQAQSRYEHGGFTEPHIPWTTEVSDGQRVGRPPAIVLLDQPEQGNALYYLFEDNLQLIQLIARQQTMSSGEASWNAFCHVIKLGLEQGALILPSAVGSLVAIYQAHQLLSESAHALGQRHWGEAFADFIAALASMVSARQGLEDFRREVSTSELRDTPRAALKPLPLYSSLRAELARFEATDVALTDLAHDALLNMYLSADGASHYAIVDGKVMQVMRSDQGWFIVGKQGDGPTITLDAKQKWHADFDIASMGAGYSLMDNYEVWITELNLVDVFIPQAEGIEQIRSRFPRHHQMIVQAHAHSVSCLRNALKNLNQREPYVPLPAQTTEILTDMFEVDVTPAMLQRLRSGCAQLLDELTSDALDPQTSARYWDGLNEQGHQGNHAFVWETDPQKRIFLTDEFFVLPNETLMYSSHQRTQAQLYAHHQAASLLHELSHQVLKTVDLAYMDSFLPLPEHFDDSGGPYSQAQRYAHDLAQLRQRALSLSTPDSKLFTRRGTRGRRDFRSNDGRQRNVVLTLSGKATLAQAREAFRTDPEIRAKIIMANADSLTLLIAKLGQEVFPHHGA